VRRLILLVALVACAQQGFPPGGPPDKIPPKLLKTAPDSNARNVSEKEVNFQYDEVLTERPSGASSLGMWSVMTSQNETLSLPGR